MSFERFPLGLDQDQEQRAARLHDECTIVDLLYQGPVTAGGFTPAMDAVLRELWEARRDAAEVLVECFDLPVKEALAGRLESFRDVWLQSGVTAGNRQIEFPSLERELALVDRQFESFDWLTKALVADDIRRAKAEGRAAGYVSSQLMLGPPASLDAIGEAHRRGLRMLQLTYNSKTTIGTGCMEPDEGLTEFGVAVVECLNDLGVILDTSHCGRATTLDACDRSTQPVVASHTAAQALWPHDRGKSDEELRAIAATGGVVGVCVVPFFLAKDAAAADLNSWLDHVVHLADVVGPRHVAIGTDWPLPIPDWVHSEVLRSGAEIGLRPKRGEDPTLTLDGFGDYREFGNFTRGLVARGFDDDEIRGVLGENFLRVFALVCG